MTKNFIIHHNLEWSMDKCPRSYPLLLSFKFLVQDSSASRPGRHFTLLRMHWPNIRMAFPWSAYRRMTQTRNSFSNTVSYRKQIFWVPWQENTEVVRVWGLKQSRAWRWFATCNAAPLALLRATFSPLCRTDCKLFDLLLEDDRGVRICHRSPRDVYRISYLRQEMN